MKKTTAKKLTLSKDTLRTLNPRELRDAAGGFSSSYNSYFCPPDTTDLKDWISELKTQCR